MKYELIKFESNRSIEAGEKIAKLRKQDAISFFHKYSKSFFERDCPVCGSHEKEKLRPFLNMYGISKCRKCGLLYVNPCPSKEALNYYYSTSLSTKESNQLLEKRAASNKKNKNLDSRLKFLETFLSKRRNMRASILEIGCSIGGFIERSIDCFGDTFDFTISGVDVDPRSIEIAGRKELNVHCSNIEETLIDRNETYDLVLHFELIEHLTNPLSFVKNCYKLLNDKGVIYFSTPNYQGLDNVAVPYDFPLRMMAHAISPPFHLSGFNSTSIYQLLSSTGFLDIEISTPGKLDIDLIGVHANRTEIEEIYSDLLRLDADALGLFQELIARLGCSSHMHVRACK